jgi:hypothetical protein
MKLSHVGTEDDEAPVLMYISYNAGDIVTWCEGPTLCGRGYPFAIGSSAEAIWYPRISSTDLND